ncbi:MAG TPA: hypothetical protein VEJ44_02285 [Acidimicrobiales bacterium]|nr:hypothetical protein [Acidimicrobiales bacterium]
MSRVQRSHPVRVFLACAAVAASMGGAVLVSGLAATSASAQSETPQHYLCYKASAKKGFVVPPGITLINAFTSAKGFTPTVGAANVHCNPAVKVVPTGEYQITNSTWHFLGFKITASQPSVTVPVNNQFGSAQLVTSSPNELLVPSWKSLTGPPDESSNTPPGEDHYTCYPVTYATGSPKFEPPASIRVQDEFSPGELTSVTVTKLVNLCAPTEKILPSGAKSTVSNPSLFYTCFTVSKTPIITPVYDENQFGTGTVTVKSTDWLCLPSTIGNSANARR